MSDQLRDDVRNLFEPFERILQPAHDRLIEQERRQSSLSDQLRDLTETFSAIDAELRIMSAAAV